MHFYLFFVSAERNWFEPAHARAQVDLAAARTFERAFKSGRKNGSEVK